LDTKLKTNKFFLLVLFVLMIFAISIPAASIIYKKSVKDNNYFDTEQFTSQLQKLVIKNYYDTKAYENRGVSYMDVYFNGYDENSEFYYTQEDYKIYHNGKNHNNTKELLKSFFYEFNENMKYEIDGNIKYVVYDDKGEVVLSNDSRLATGVTDYPYWASIEFDEKGNGDVISIRGGDVHQLNDRLRNTSMDEVFYNIFNDGYFNINPHGYDEYGYDDYGYYGEAYADEYLYEEYEEEVNYGIGYKSVSTATRAVEDFPIDGGQLIKNIMASDLSLPKNFNIVFAYDETIGANSDYYSGYRASYTRGNFATEFYGFARVILMLTVIFTIILYKDSLNGNSLVSKIPFEIVFVFTIFILSESHYALTSNAFYTQQTAVASNIFSSLFSTGMGEISSSISKKSYHYVMYLKDIAIVITIVHLLVIYYLHALKNGFFKHIFDTSICVTVCRKIKNFFYNYSRNLKLDSLSNKELNKKIKKILFWNYVILCGISCFWFVGIFLLIIYMAIVYKIIKRNIEAIQKDYNNLLQVTGKVANGSLDTQIDLDFGLFTPFSAELGKINTNVQLATDSKVKSQRMKTELISNVSHDLKTPLTAIITYIGLLKQENLSSDNFDSYVNTLDQKSQRLKVLIDDLFEISKVSSGNIDLKKENVNLFDLITQVQWELNDEVHAARIEFVNDFKMQTAVFELDPEKTYRIFENLFLNITKYALEGTRAYTIVQKVGNSILVEIKNISKEQVKYNGEELTERFVRGDEARNTDGSGLGLSIARSFVEVQNGQFNIIVDGDLFKVEIVFNSVV